MDNPAGSTESASTVRRRLREDDSPNKRIKRAKAAERQRRKRERDRNAAANNMASAIVTYAAPPTDHGPPLPVQQSISAPLPQSSSPGSSGHQSASFGQHEPSQEELARRERVRAAARERQRKHRQLVKERKLRALGVEMGNEMIPGMQNPEGAPPFHHVLPPGLQNHPPPPDMGHGHPSQFPPGQLSGGRLFASTILLSFSCDPLLKQHLMRTLHMSHDELASLEPVIADAWEHWDHQRRLRGVPANGGPSAPPGAPNGPHPYTPPPPVNGDSPQNEFRARFRSSIEVPPPFAPYSTNAQAETSSATPAVPSAESIDPKLESVTANLNDAAKKGAVSNIDPNLAQQGKSET